MNSPDPVTLLNAALQGRYAIEPRWKTTIQPDFPVLVSSVSCEARLVLRDFAW